MKFTFEADLDYQRDAIDAVTGLFKGQESLTSHFTVQAHAALSEGLFEASGDSWASRPRATATDCVSRPRRFSENLHAAQDKHRPGP